MIYGPATFFILCPMCQANVANAENAAELSSVVNDAVLVLLIPTIIIICCLVGLVIKYRRP